MLIFSDSTKNKICEYAKKEYPSECCGILTGKREERGRIVHNVIPTRNVVDEKLKKTHFQIDPLEFVRIEQEASSEEEEIVGFYHSHPDYGAEASAEDISYMIADYSYPIIAVKKGECTKINSYVRNDSNTLSAQEERIIVEERTGC